MSAEEFAAAREAGLGHFVEVSHFSDDNITAYRDAVRAGAATLASEAGDYANPPMEKGFAYITEGEEVIPKSLDGLKDALVEIRAGFDASHNPAEAQGVYNKIDVILNQIEIAQRLPGYSDDMIAKVSETLGVGIALGVQGEINSADPDPVAQQLAPTKGA